MSAEFLKKLSDAAAKWRRLSRPRPPSCRDCDKEIALAKTKLAAGLPVNIAVAFPCTARTIVLRECAAAWACCLGPVHEISLDECVNCEKRRW